MPVHFQPNPFFYTNKFQGLSYILNQKKDNEKIAILSNVYY